jgi:hypothetical protein
MNKEYVNIQKEAVIYMASLEGVTEANGRNSLGQWHLPFQRSVLKQTDWENKKLTVAQLVKKFPAFSAAVKVPYHTHKAARNIS